MTAAITNFIQLVKENKIAILGDMFELGKESLSEHKKIVELLENQKSIQTYFIGKDFYSNRINSNHLHFFEDFNSFSKFIEANKPKDFKKHLDEYDRTCKFKEIERKTL